jgi:hypothetical protein
MAVVAINNVTYSQINAAATRAQVFGGRVQVAESASPSAKDFQVWPEGAVIDITAVKWALAIDTKETWIVTQAV